jgi:hypothetical protein
MAIHPAERHSAASPHSSYNTHDAAGTTDTTKMTEYHKGQSSLEEQVRCLVGETSEKFIPAPTQDQVISDAFEGIRRFKEAVRWKDFFRSQKIETIQQE